MKSKVTHMYCNITANDRADNRHDVFQFLFILIYFIIVILCFHANKLLYWNLYNEDPKISLSVLLTSHMRTASIELNEGQPQALLPSWVVVVCLVSASLCWRCCYCLLDQLWILIAYTSKSKNTISWPACWCHFCTVFVCFQETFKNTLVLLVILYTIFVI